jgi:hypothetical protein
MLQMLPIGTNPAIYLRRLRYFSGLEESKFRAVKVHKDIHSCKNSQFFLFKKLIIIVPFESSKDWKFAHGNWFFELYQSALDFFPEHEVEVFFISKSKFLWSTELYQRILKDPQVSILTFIENSGTNNLQGINFELLIELRKIWRGILVGLMFDSVWPDALNHAYLMSWMDRGILVVAIDRNIGTGLPKDCAHIGPLFLPISRGSIKKLQAMIIPKPKSVKLSFVGKIYPTREHIITSIDSAFPALEILSTFSKNRSDYISYMKSLSISQYTLNLARANAQSIFQLKCRILEAALMSTTIVTDEKKYIQKYFDQDVFIYFTNPLHLVGLINKFDENLEAKQQKAKHIAETLSPIDFWMQIMSAIRHSKNMLENDITIL